MKEECWKSVSDNRLSSHLFSLCISKFLREQEQRDREETRYAEKMTEIKSLGRAASLSQF